MTFAVRESWVAGQTACLALAGHPGLPRATGGRPSGVVLVHTAGTRHRGLEGVHRILGDRGCAWHYLVTPGAVVAGRLAVWELAPTGWVSPIAPGCLVVGVCGWYPSRWSSIPGPRVDPLEWVALGDLLAYLLAVHGLPGSALLGGWERGIAPSPGDELEQWIRHYRGDPGVLDPREDYTPPEPLAIQWPQGHFGRPMSCERAGALLERRGFGVGQGTRVWSDALHVACAAFQTRVGLVPTGCLDYRTEDALRRGQADLVA